MRRLLLPIGCMLFGLPVFAQSAGTNGIYKLDFAVHDVEGGKRVSTRNYTMLVEGGGRGYARVGSKVPVPGAGGQYQFIDVGLNLDCRVIERPGALVLDTTLEISELDGKTPPPASSIRSVRTGAVSIVQPGKNTLLSSLDDLTAKRRYELEVTAAPVR